MKINPHDAAGNPDGIQLFVCQIPGRRTQGMHTGMRRHHRFVGNPFDIPKPFFIQVRDIDKNAQAVA